MADWNSIEDNRIVVNSTLISGVNAGAFGALTSIPNDQLGATKARATQYVNIAANNPYLAAKTSNQLVAKRDLNGITSYQYSFNYSPIDYASACSSSTTVNVYSPDAVLTNGSSLYSNVNFSNGVDIGYYSDTTNSYFVDQASFTFDADYMVLNYKWTDGDDLDTRTRIVVPDIGQTTQSTYIGWSLQGVWPTTGTPILTWGGDNTNVGYEAVLLNVAALKAAYPSASTMTVDLRAFWYSVVGTNDVVLDAILWKGGTPIAQGSGGNPAFSFTNPTATATQYVVSVGKPITLATQASSTSGERVGTLTYNLSTGLGSFNINDTTTPSV